MKTKYKNVAAQFAARLRAIETEVDTMIGIAVDAIIDGTGNQDEIDLSDYQVRVGAFESFIDGYAAVETLCRDEGTICIKLELMEDFMPLASVSSLTLFDKAEILKALEHKMPHKN